MGRAHKPLAPGGIKACSMVGPMVQRHWCGMVQHRQWVTAPALWQVFGQTERTWGGGAEHTKLGAGVPGVQGVQGVPGVPE